MYTIHAAQEEHNKQQVTLHVAGFLQLQPEFYKIGQYTNNHCYYQVLPG